MLKFPSFIRWPEKGGLQIEQIGAAAPVEARDEALGPGPAGWIEAASPVGRLLVPQVITHVGGCWNLKWLRSPLLLKNGGRNMEISAVGKVENLKTG